MNIGLQHGSCTDHTGGTIWVCKRFEFEIRSVNNMKMAKHKITKQSENGSGWDNYTDR